MRFGATLAGMGHTARRTKRAETLDLLVGPQPVDIVVDGAVVHLPDDLRDVLREAAGLASRGVEVAVVASDRTLSTGEAADMLGVSRAYLVELLNARAIPFQRPAGSHRRLLMGDVVQYQARRRADRGAALAELAAAEADIPYS